MAAETEIERLVVRLLGDASSYQAMLKQAEAATRRTAREIERAGRRIERIQMRLRALGTAFMSAGRVMRQFGRSMTLFVTGPILAATAAIFKLGAGFEAEMSKITGLVGIAKEQVGAWSKDILEMAPKLGKAPRELAQGLFFVTSAGFRGAAAMDVLTIAARASAAGLGDTATVADAITSAVNAYGAENLSAARSADILTAAVREGKLEAGAIAPILGRILPMSSALGVSFEDVAGALAVMSRTGADAAQAGTSIQSLMMALQKPTEEARKMLDEAGLSFQTLRDMVRKPGGVIDAMRLLDKTFGDDEEALAAIIPNIRALRGVLNILAQDSSVVDSVMQGVRDSTGSVDRAFGAAAETAQFKFNAAMAKMKATLIAIGRDVIPVVNTVLTALSDVLAFLAKIWQSLNPVVRKFFIILLFVLAAIGPVIWATGLLTSGIGWLMKGAAAAIPWIIGLTKSFLALSASILTNPITWIVVGIVAALVALGSVIAWLMGFDVAGFFKKIFGFGGKKDVELGFKTAESLKIPKIEMPKGLELPNVDKVEIPKAEDIQLPKDVGEQVGEAEARSKPPRVWTQALDRWSKGLTVTPGQIAAHARVGGGQVAGLTPPRLALPGRPGVPVGGGVQPITTQAPMTPVERKSEERLDTIATNTTDLVELAEEMLKQMNRMGLSPAGLNN